MTPTTIDPILDDKLLRSIKATYRTLRLGLGWAAVGLPLTLWLVGLVRDVPLQGSMSAYYNTNMRDVFVGVLFGAGAGLLLYTGFKGKENRVLNLAGVFAIGVALFPTRADAGRITLHGTCAVSFFVCLAYVAWFRNGDTLKLVKDPKRVAQYLMIYRLLAFGMLVFPVAAAVLVSAFEYGQTGGESKVVFFIEAAAIWAFGAFWLVKSREIRRTLEEQKTDSDPEVRALV